jgi:hypothetical protein
VHNLCIHTDHDQINFINLIVISITVVNISSHVGGKAYDPASDHRN